MRVSFLKLLAPVAILVALVGALTGQGEKRAESKSLKALLVTGGCCHDYKVQKDIITAGIGQRVPVDWTVFFEMDQKKSKEYLSKEGWADDYDFIVYNHCFAKEADTAFIDSVVAVHEKGKPAVALHCAMHSYHWNVKAKEGEEKTWPKFLGVSSKGHGPKASIEVAKVEEQAKHPVLKDLPDGWKTPEGELYNVQKVLGSATVLAYGDNGKVKEPQVCIWVNEFGPRKTRVFGTTIGHHNSTMSTNEYLDLLGNGVRWIMKMD